MLLKNARGGARTVSAGADHGRGFSWIKCEFGYVLLQTQKRSSPRLWYMTTLVFGWTTHIENLQRSFPGDEFFQFVDSDLRHAGEFQSNVAPGCDTAGEITFHIFDAYSRQSHHRLGCLFLRLRHDHYWTLNCEQRPSPNRKLSTQSNVDCTRQVSRAKLCSPAHIQDLVTCGCKFFHFLGREGCRPRYLLKAGRASAINLRVARKVSRRLRQIDGHHLYKVILRHWPQRVV